MPIDDRARLDATWDARERHVIQASILYNIMDGENQELHQDGLDRYLVSLILAIDDDQELRMLVDDPNGGPNPILRTLRLKAGGA